MGEVAALKQPEQEADGAGIWPKLALAREAISGIAKTGHNPKHDYNYAPAEDVVREAKSALAAQNLIVIASVEDVGEHFGRGRDKRAALMLKVQMTFEVIDSTTGQSIKKSWVGYGYDQPGDKAIYKAITGATKYFLASLLAIPFVGSDPEDTGAPPDSPEAQAERDRQDREAEQPDAPGGTDA